MIEIVEFGGRRLAEVIRREVRVERSTFFSRPADPFQLGLLAHRRGFVEATHVHPPVERRIVGLAQMLVVQSGVAAVDFFGDGGVKVAEVVLNPGDAIVIMDGAHSLRVLEDMQAVSVKQGPFLGPEMDKIDVKVGE